MVITPGARSSITSVTTVSTAGEIKGFLGLAAFRTPFLALVRLGLSFAPRPLATVRFGDFLRADLETLRTLRYSRFSFPSGRPPFPFCHARPPLPGCCRVEYRPKSLKQKAPPNQRAPSRAALSSHAAVSGALTAANDPAYEGPCPNSKALAKQLNRLHLKRDVICRKWPSSSHELLCGKPTVLTPADKKLATSFTRTRRPNSASFILRSHSFHFL
jgi:hypothetical protein